MGKSKNGAIVGKILKGLISVAITLFAAKKGKNKWGKK